ncbi:hypothetical protein [Actinokineospora diospyrosa]|uniref:Uncharacterized protein n=1 Tax=Actinokineospora diospyrosa TaxID=103728 RepID=A0ABT1I596_9PSEU|nr:hypothetical protein [Actinokineospora diospyrosa]MCP2267741.1 hypothetical protein [Actinokineospora diospyrosa]
MQFYFGGCALEVFEIGDKITWGQYDLGEPGHRLVVTEGLGAPCPGCGGPHAPPPVYDPGTFDIFIEDDVITHARWSDGEFPFQLEPWRSDSLFFVLDDYPPSMGNWRDSPP